MYMKCNIGLIISIYVSNNNNYNIMDIIHRCNAFITYLILSPVVLTPYAHHYPRITM